MDEKELRRQAREVEKEIKDANDDKDSSESEIKTSSKGPIFFIIAMFMILILVFYVVPAYVIKIDPRPGEILSLSDVNEDIKVDDYNSSIKNIYSYRSFYEPSDKQIKQISDRIVSTACDGEIVCQSKALFYFTRDEIDYIKDPDSFEYLKTPADTLYSGGGDCDDKTLLLANMLGAIGVRTRLVFIPNHVYLEAYIPDAADRYRDESGWVNLDATCSNCAFGEIPRENIDAEKIYLEI